MHFCGWSKFGRVYHINVTSFLILRFTKSVPVLKLITTTPWRLVESGCKYPRILYEGTRWRWVISSTPRPFNPPYPLNRRLGGPKNLSGRRGEKINLASTGDQTSTPRSFSLSPYRLSYPDLCYDIWAEGKIKVSPHCAKSRKSAWVILHHSLSRAIKWRWAAIFTISPLTRPAQNSFRTYDSEKFPYTSTRIWTPAI
jgi:hypothetical protein